jgi:hypothetical protein
MNRSTIQEYHENNENWTCIYLCLASVSPMRRTGHAVLCCRVVHRPLADQELRRSPVESSHAPPRIDPAPKRPAVSPQPDATQHKRSLQEVRGSGAEQLAGSLPFASKIETTHPPIHTHTHHTQHTRIGSEQLFCGELNVSTTRMPTAERIDAHGWVWISVYTIAANAQQQHRQSREHLAHE